MFGLLLLPRINLIIKEINAFLFNKAFVCRILNGHCLIVNCDLTVSCNCDDLYGFGQIGSLKNQGLREIFFGKRANYFRKKLASGKLPIINCLSCEWLVSINKINAWKNVNNFKFPQALVVENTVNCNLRCLCCDRETICSLRGRQFMSLEEIKKISVELKINKVKFVNYFGIGEPFFSNNIKDELEIIKKDNPEIKILVSTNGMIINTQYKVEAALLLDLIIFSIHGSDQISLQKYQRDGDFLQSYNNMKNLVVIRNRLKKTGPKIIWKYVLFRWNDSKKNIEEAIKLAKEAGVDGMYFERTTAPLRGISYKSYLGIGYINKIKKFDGKIANIKL